MAPVANKEDSPNLILAGFMGTGKSALGRQLAKRWRRRFYDTDELVEKLAGVSIADIFAEHGEEHFRALERQVVESLLPVNGAVIACGGGLVVPPGMGELVRSKGIVVTLFASVDTILRRTAGNSRRPLLKGDDPEAKIRDLMKKREQAYMTPDEVLAIARARCPGGGLDHGGKIRVRDRIGGESAYASTLADDMV